VTIEYDGKKWIGEFLQNRTYAEIKADGSKESRTETINRTRDMHVRKFPELVSEITDAFTYVHRGMVVPSMRSLQFGGAAIEKVNERIYNCAFANITSWDDIHDAFFLLMCGTGFGYSVKQRHVNQLPTIKKVSEHSGKLTYTIADKKEGWADSVRMLLDNPNVEFDYSLIRPKGSLISSGGTASGPDALMKTHEEIRRILIQAAGRKLTSTEVHDIMCHVADGVVVGGVRRAALICLFDADDEAMNKAKISRYRFECKDTPITDENGEPTGLVIYGCGHTEEAIEGYTPTDEQEICQSCGKVNDYSDYSWYITNPQRGRANNSAVIYRDAVNDSIFGWPQGMSQSTDNSILAVMDHMLNSGSGEPGISLSNDPDMGFNPCHEIALKDGGLCNLTEVNVNACKSVEDIYQAMRAATFIGTLQASYTDFKVLQPKWKLNADNEALLGVSLTGQADNWKMLQEALSDKSLITEGIQTHNFRVSKKIGINPAKRITTTKPSGSTSAWLGCSSGIHADHAPFYIRHIRMEKNHKIVEALQSSEYPFLEQDQMDVDKMVVGFPVKAEEGAITKSDESAIELMERAKFIYKNWILAGHREGNNTHNVSLTVEYKPDEIEAIKKWMVDNKDSYAGISFLPRNDSTYTQMPFQEITEEEYNEMVAKITKPIDYISIDWTGTIDERIGEAACAGGSCEIT
jgi:ribonucleoside-diphosphate reductase alpha chain